MVDFRELDKAYCAIMAMFEAQGLISPISYQHKVVSPHTLQEVYYNPG